MRYLILILLIALTGCGTIPKEYSAEEVDCHYMRKGIKYDLECKIKGNVEIGGSIIDIVR